MTPMTFKDAFWGSGFTCHAGYDAMIQRLRDGRQMCKDVEELLKMRALAEEKYGKELVTIVRKAGGQTEISTLRSSFEQLKTQIENIGNFHIQLSDLLKEEVKKMETFRERQKDQRKKFQSIMEKLQKNKVSLYKKTMESKKNYEQRCREADEAERGAEKTNVSTKNSDKMRQKAKQSRQTASEAEKLYLSNITQLENVRVDWEETHRGTCEVFQQLEGDRISMLRSALWDHCNHFSAECIRDDDCHEEVRKTLENCDITTDNNCFISMKGTGSRPPDPILFESYYQVERPGSSNGQAHLIGGRDDMRMRSSDSLLASSVSPSVDSLHDSQSVLTSADEFELSEGGYAPVPSLQYSASVPTVSAEDNYTVLYEYSAQEQDELSVSRGDTVRIVERRDDGWWTVERLGVIGLVPGNYLGQIC
ncbi:uncharacterized protein V6R79_019941 [Siganus canaliculatus]